MKGSEKSKLSVEAIEQRVLFIRGVKVMLDSDLARLYEVRTKVFNQSVFRHRKRFPPDFMFQLTLAEAQNLRSQIVTSSWGGRRYRPYVFTEQGIAMLSSVLNSDRAIQVNIAIMRAFLQLRRVLANHQELAGKLELLERKYDAQFRAVFDAIRKLMEPRSSASKRRIGFHP